MAYEYEKDVVGILEYLAVEYRSNGYYDMSAEVEECLR